MFGRAKVLRPYEKFRFAAGAYARDVYRRGAGPGVIIIHEMPGLHPGVVRFADRVVEAGMTVYLPDLFGVAGKPVSSGYVLTSLVDTMCVRREFNVWRTGRSSPIVDWLRPLARQAHADCGGRGVGAVGMCFTGGFALAMMSEPAVVAPVLAQPSMPVALGSAVRAAGIDASPDQISCARARFEAEDLSMVGLRFKSDKAVPAARFDALTAAFGERFERIELEDSAAAASDRPPHSVLTIHLREDGPGKAAEQRVIAFLKERTALPPQEPP